MPDPVAEAREAHVCPIDAPCEAEHELIDTWVGDVIEDDGDARGAPPVDVETLKKRFSSLALNPDVVIGPAQSFHMLLAELDRLRQAKEEVERHLAIVARQLIDQQADSDALQRRLAALASVAQAARLVARPYTSEKRPRFWLNGITQLREAIAVLDADAQEQGEAVTHE